jgi:hypothetical protein
VIELKVETRPEPTIYGNCDSWSFIVGKKDSAYSAKISKKGELQHRNKNLMHNLLTNFDSLDMDNM